MSTEQRISRRTFHVHALSAALSLALASTAGTTEAAPGARQVQPNVRTQHAATKAAFDSQVAGSRLAAVFARGKQAQAATPIPSRAPATHTISSLADQGSGSLREALATAVDGDVIDLAGLSGTIALSSALEPAAAVSIRGPENGRLVLDAGHHDRVIRSGHSLTLSNVSLVNGNGGDAVAGGPALGGCLYVNGNLTLTHATISGCSVGDADTPASYGGAIAVAGYAYMKYSTISNSTATAHTIAGGGGIAAQGNIQAFSSTISGNTAHKVVAPETMGHNTPAGGPPPNAYTAIGGGILGGASAVAMIDSTVTGNKAQADGSNSFVCYYYDYTPYYCTYWSRALGGGVASPVPAMLASTISGNSVLATGNAYGGGVYAPYLSASPYLRSSTPASIALGGIIGGTPTPSFKYDTISGNSATSSDSWAYGGGIMVSNPTTVTSSSIDHNRVQADSHSFYSSGGGILSASALTIQSSTISGNSVISSGEQAGAWGGGIGMWFGKLLTLTDSTVSGNQIAAPYSANGGGIGASVFQISNSTIAFNTAQGNGGGVVLYGYGDGLSTLDSTIIASNSATAGPASADVFGYTGSMMVTGGNNLVMTNVGATLPGDTSTDDPQLLPLAFNGGLTRTHALAATSPAIDAGSNPLALENDQRGPGYNRVVGAAADIGAFEFETDHIFVDGFDGLLGGS